MAGDTPRLLAVFAHPDDETFRPGGTLALLVRLGVVVQVVSATYGEAGSCGEPPLCTPEELPEVRQRELRAACTALGVLPPQFLGYQDGTLEQVEAEAGIAQILSIVNAVQPQVLLSFGPDGLSGHPDHIAIGKWALEAYQRAENVAALYTLAVPQSVAGQLGMRQVHAVADADIAFGVDVSSVWETKLAAIRCHATQLSATPLLRAPEERQRLFFEREYFVKAAERDSQGNFLPGVLKDFLL
ncbi:MAG: PIG-L deacetylase family protein [Chloroflexota bacterium]